MKKKIIIAIGAIVTLLLASLGLSWYSFTQSPRYQVFQERNIEREAWNEAVLHQPVRFDTIYSRSLRSEIVDELGNVIARSKVVYDLRFDPSAYSGEDWNEKFIEFSEGMAEIFTDMSAAKVYVKLRKTRQSGKHYIKLKEGIDSATLARVYNIKEHFVGLIVEDREARVYPYGELARRTIGIVRNPGIDEYPHIGLEGAFNDMLSGEKGYVVRKTKWVKPFYKKFAERKQTIVKQVPAVDGEKVFTTLNMERQSLADSILRAEVSNKTEIEGATLVIMAVDRGAVVAMVNLCDYAGNGLGEYYNVAIAHPYEPGSCSILQ